METDAAAAVEIALPNSNEKSKEICLPSKMPKAEIGEYSVKFLLLHNHFVLTYKLALSSINY